YRLPNDEEWEYAAKGGENYQYSGSNDINSVAWYNSNSGGKTNKVGLKKSNGFKLHDMTGNVWEWTSSSKDGGYVFRGGSYNEFYLSCYVWFDIYDKPEANAKNLGFRLVR
ncbi:MAG: SUMF1/EgtB/PvdO family nonheme iron enzyme, partial [Saprospiraceae bacterium]|nr:SUMF1/EgtB/PvdO family nonheme iron enzyme [Saprospiraceae bacterium]